MNPTLTDKLLIVTLTIVTLIFLYILSRWCYSCCSSNQEESDTRTLISEVSKLHDKVVRLQRIVHNQTIVVELEDQTPVQLKARDRDHHVSFELPSLYEQLTRDNSPEVALIHKNYNSEELLEESQLLEETNQSPEINIVKEESIDPNQLSQILTELQELRSLSEDNKALVETHTNYIAKIQSQLSKKKHK